MTPGSPEPAQPLDRSACPHWSPWRPPCSRTGSPHCSGCWLPHPLPAAFKTLMKPPRLMACFRLEILARRQRRARTSAPHMRTHRREAIKRARHLSANNNPRARSLRIVQRAGSPRSGTPRQSRAPRGPRGAFGTSHPLAPTPKLTADAEECLGDRVGFIMNLPAAMPGVPSPAPSPVGRLAPMRSVSLPMSPQGRGVGRGAGLLSRRRCQ